MTHDRHAHEIGGMSRLQFVWYVIAPRMVNLLDRSVSHVICGACWSHMSALTLVLHCGSVNLRSRWKKTWNSLSFCSTSYKASIKTTATT